MSISTSTNPTTSIAPTIRTRTFNTTRTRGGVPYKDQRVAQQYNRGQSPTAGTRDDYRDVMASSQIVPVIAQEIVLEIAPVIVQEIAPVIVREIAPPALATAVQIRVMSEGQAQAHVMSAAVGEIRTSAAMSAAAAVMSAAVGPAPARQIVAVAAAVATTVVAVATMDQAARRLAVAPVHRRAAAAVARPAWRARVVAAEELAAVVEDAVEVGDDGY